MWHLQARHPTWLHGSASMSTELCCALMYVSCCAVQIFTRPFVDGDSVMVQGIGNMIVSGVVEKTTGAPGVCLAVHPCNLNAQGVHNISFKAAPSLHVVDKAYQSSGLHSNATTRCTHVGSCAA